MLYINFSHSPFRRACGVLVAAIFLLGSASFSYATLYQAGPAMPATIEAPEAPVIVYNSTTGGTLTPATGTGAASFLVPVSFSAGVGTYSITQMVLGVNFNAIGNGQQDIFIDFYNGLDLSPGAADALSGATSAGPSAGIGLTDPTGTIPGNYAYTVTFTTPLILNIGANFGMVFSFVDDQTLTYSNEISGLFRLGGAPSVGGSPGFVYNDADFDGTFPGSEQTMFGNATSANYYLRVTADVPEPSTWAMLVGGLGIVALALRRRCRA